MKTMPTKPEAAIYFDHAAATPLKPLVLEAMAPFLGSEFANPSSITAGGVRARVAIEAARAEAAVLVGAHTDEVTFTSGGTESANLALQGVMHAAPVGSHMVTTALEHDAVLETARFLERQGFGLTVVGADSNGVVDVAEIIRAITSTTRLVSVMYANNEIGTIQPIAELARALRRLNRTREAAGLPAVLLHTDACQAAGYLDMSVVRLGVDLLTWSAAKIGGPKGAGALFCRRGVTLAPLIIGGGHERGLRAGTENVAAIVGFGRACELLTPTVRTEEGARLGGLRDQLAKELQRKVPQLVINGAMAEHLPNNLSLSVTGVDAEALVLYLDQAGLTIGAGAACSNLTLEPSHVLLAIGKTEAQALETVRITLGWTTTPAEVKTAGRLMAETIAWLRRPLVS